MNRNLNTKLVQIFIVFIISVMTVVGVILLNSVFNFYKNDFVEQMDSGYYDRRSVDVTVRRLRQKIEDDDSAPKYILNMRSVGYYMP